MSEGKLKAIAAQTILAILIGGFAFGGANVIRGARTPLGAPNPPPIRWSDLGPQAGEIDQLALDPSISSVVFAGGMHVGLYRSTNGGNSWTPDSPSQEYYVTSLATAPNQPGAVFVTVAGKLFTSNNDGGVWSQDTSCSGYSIKYYVSPVDPQVRYLLCGSLSAGVSASLLRSSDGGLHWTSLPLGNSLEDVRDVAVSKNTIYVLGSYQQTELLRSVDGGGTWNVIQINFTGPFHSALAVSPDNPSIVMIGGTSSLYRSADGGKTWKDVLDESIGVSEGFVAFDSSNGSVSYAGRVGLWKSMDAGVSFKLLGSNEANPTVGSYHVDPGAIAIDHRSGEVYLGTDGGVFVTHDSGASWTWLPNEMKNGLVLAAAVDSSDSRHIITIRQDWGPTQTRDGGTNWNGLTHPFNELGSVQFDPSNPSTVYIATGGGVWKSTDGGLNFYQTDSGLSSLDKEFIPNGMQVKVNPLNHTEIWLAAGNYFYKSTDSGAHWQNVTVTSNEGPFNGVGDVAPIGNVVYASYVPPGSTQGGIWRSENHGTNWTQLGLPTSLTFYDAIVDPQYPSAVFALGSSSNATPVVYASYDSGTTFVPLTLPPIGLGSPKLAAGGPMNGLRLVLGSTFGGLHEDLFESADNGNSWVPITSNMNVTQVVEIGVSTSNPDSVYVATFGGGLEYSNITLAQLTTSTSSTTTSSHSSQTSSSSTSSSVTTTSRSSPRSTTSTSPAATTSTTGSQLPTSSTTMPPTMTGQPGTVTVPETVAVAGIVVIAIVAAGILVLRNRTR